MAYHQGSLVVKLPQAASIFLQKLRSWRVATEGLVRLFFYNPSTACAVPLPLHRGGSYIQCKRNSNAQNAAQNIGSLREGAPVADGWRRVRNDIFSTNTIISQAPTVIFLRKCHLPLGGRLIYSRTITPVKKAFAQAYLQRPYGTPTNAFRFLREIIPYPVAGQ